MACTQHRAARVQALRCCDGGARVPAVGGQTEPMENTSNSRRLGNRGGHCLGLSGLSSCSPPRRVIAQSRRGKRQLPSVLWPAACRRFSLSPHLVCKDLVQTQPREAQYPRFKLRKRVGKAHNAPLTPTRYPCIELVSQNMKFSSREHLYSISAVCDRLFMIISFVVVVVAHEAQPCLTPRHSSRSIHGLSCLFLPLSVSDFLLPRVEKEKKTSRHLAENGRLAVTVMPITFPLASSSPASLICDNSRSLLSSQLLPVPVPSSFILSV